MVIKLVNRSNVYPTGDPTLFHITYWKTDHLVYLIKRLLKNKLKPSVFTTFRRFPVGYKKKRIRSQVIKFRSYIQGSVLGGFFLRFFLLDFQDFCFS